jgi:hypothetical protein
LATQQLMALFEIIVIESLMKKSYFFLFFVLLSCSKKNNLVESKAFEAKYSNRELLSISNNLNFETMCENVKPFNFGKRLIFDSLSTFSIDILNKNTLNITCENSQNQIRRTKIKFDFDGEYLVLKRNFKFQGIPLIFFRYKEIHLEMKLDSTQNLDVDFEGEAGGAIFIISGGGTIKHHSKFQRLNLK